MAFCVNHSLTKKVSQTVALIVSDSSAREQITIMGSKFLDGRVAKEIIFTSRARAYNDFRGYWMEDFCSLIH